MKTKIIIVGVITLFAYTLLSFQIIGNDQTYFSVTDNPLRCYQNNATQTTVSCAKCHDCQKGDLVTEDSSAVKSQKHLEQFNSTKMTIEKISPVQLDDNGAEYSENFKSN